MSTWLPIDTKVSDVLYDTYLYTTFLSIVGTIYLEYEFTDTPMVLLSGLTLGDIVEPQGTFSNYGS